MNKNTNVHTKGNAHAKGKSKNISLDTLMFKKEIKDRFHFKETTFQKWVHLPDVRAFKVGGK